MPLKLNVGLSKKVGEPNYGSRGASVNVEVELDGALVTQPDRMRERIREVFALARNAIDEELQTSGSHPRHLADANMANGHGVVQDNGHATNGRNGNGNGNGRPATQSQARAIHAIARRQRVDLPKLLRERFGVDRPEDLTLRDASELIDELNGAATGNGGRG